MKKLFLVLIICYLLVACKVYIGPPEYSLQCVHNEPIAELRLSDNLTDHEIVAYQKAANAWKSATMVNTPIRVTNDSQANVKPGKGTIRSTCWEGLGTSKQCIQAANVSWASGEAIITHKSVMLDPYPVALHEVGHAIAGNPCHASDPNAQLMCEGCVSSKIKEADAAYVLKSRAQTF